MTAYGLKLKSWFFLLLSVILLVTAGCRKEREGPVVQKERGRVMLGVEVFLEKHLDLLRGRRVGLVTNPTGTNSRLQSTMDLFARNPDINLVALYGPEHGVRGNAQAGEHVPFSRDEKYNLPVFSLYGQTRKPASGMLKDIDAYMRSFDTQREGKVPRKSMVGGLDVMVFDIQDVGTRIYTYTATMAYCMEACAESGIAFVVLDRPNPINGVAMEGPLLEYPEYSSFVGLYPIPVRHGMTVGELALLFNDRFLARKVDLTVIPMEGWERWMWYDETSLPWVIPSPNMPALETATVYPGQVFLEGTNISEGRGTTKPFSLFGATWIDGYEIAERLNRLDLPGVAFREAWFTPVFSKYQGQLCGGAQIHIMDRDRYRPFETTLHIIKTIMDLYPDRFRFHEEYFDKLMGGPKIRKALMEGRTVEEIVWSYEKDLKRFSEERKPYLLYR
ncbi:MAG: exo-beta-N-acetylmuramidase NamZ domain-containing protein [Candidatus Aminicenantales bacterium]